MLSAFLDNVTTVILLGNVTCIIARKIKINPVPLLICEAICSNVGGTATLIGDPPNIMIGSAAGLGFNDFLLTLGPVVLITLPIVLFTLHLLFRDSLRLPREAYRVLARLSEKAAIKDRPLMIKALVVISLVLSGFLFHETLNLEPGTVALSGAAVLLIFENRKAIWQDVEWTTIFFFIGLFIIVGAVETTGGLKLVAGELLKIANNQGQFAPISLLWASAFCSSLIDNIPYTATMIPIVRTLEAHTVSGASFWWPLALGACLGGNGSLVGATANVVAADLAESHGARLGFWQFTTVGLIVTVESLLVSSGYLLLFKPAG